MMTAQPGPPGPHNRLARETSPYLLQHAANPVDWYPWGSAALSAARNRDCPVFLSVGYSACHWCHVMERESFEDAAIAEFMNTHFVNIKVDREERPDLDQIYMQAVLVQTGSGGWPMSVFLTPDLQPFYGGTYWPPRAQHGRAGFEDILRNVAAAWADRRNDVQQGADELTRAVVRFSRPRASTHELNASLISQAAHSLLEALDNTNGGFGRPPKFPQPMGLRLLLRSGLRFSRSDQTAAVELSLDRMAAGGVYDQLGGGFHRYSTDAVWLVPHFEKMLYDNALLATTYLEGFQCIGKPEYRRVVTETLDYVLREMTQTEGGFYSSQDADTEGEEGRFFVWDKQDLQTVLGANDADVFSHCYGVSEAGNWDGHNILHRPRTWQQSASELSMSTDALEQTLSDCRQRLFAARQQRQAPQTDTKVLVSWNGLMIAALAQAGSVLDESRYVETAQRAGDFILANMRDSDGRLWHCYKDGRSRFSACLDDYACLIDGLCEVFQATHQVRYLESAVGLAETMVTAFGDRQNGGFYFVPHDHERLIARTIDCQDAATPSGNAMASTSLLKLGQLCGRDDFRRIATETLTCVSGHMAHVPTAAGQSLLALDYLLGPTPEFVIMDGPTSETGDNFAGEIHRWFVPNKAILRPAADIEQLETLRQLTNLLDGKSLDQSGCTVHICAAGTCRDPVTQLESLRQWLDGPRQP